jgi:electron transfer flavoprotein beta subunit
MHILVCVKQVPDPESPPDSFVINEALKRVDPRGIPPVLSLFDENALEAAARVKESCTEPVKITIISLGKRVSNVVMQKALASGADELIKVEDECFTSCSHDSYTIASALASTIRKVGKYDLILTGRQSADWNGGQTGIGIATFLAIPAITFARKVEIVANTVLVDRVLPDGSERVRTPLPALVMVSNEIGTLRYPTILDRRDAAKKPVTVWSVNDIGFVPVRALTILKKLSMPKSQERQCKIIAGESLEAAAKKLVFQLQADKIL